MRDNQARPGLIRSALRQLIPCTLFFAACYLLAALAWGLNAPFTL